MATEPRGQYKEQHEYFSLSSQWMELSGEQVVSTPVLVKSFDLHTCTIADALGVDNAPFTFSVEEDKRISAFAGWFDAIFAGSTENPCLEVVTLSTHPKMGSKRSEMWSRAVPRG